MTAEIVPIRTAPPASKGRKRKAANGAGSVERRGELWWVQVSLPKVAGQKTAPRKRVPIEGSERMTELQAKRAGAKLARDVRDGKIVFESKPGKAPILSAVLTVREIGEGYCDGTWLRVHKAVNGLRPLATGHIMRTQLRSRVYPVKTRGPAGPDFGDLPANQVTHADIAKVMAAQTGSASTRNHIHDYLSRIFSLAEVPLGVRAVNTNPVVKAYRAPADEDKHYNFLYPPEVLALLGNREIPLGRRVLYMLANYFGWRKGSLFAFKWSGIDWDAGTVSVLKQKGKKRLDAEDDDEEQGRPIFFVATADVLAVLRAWHEHLGRPEGDTPVVRDIFAEREPWCEGRGAEKLALHADLRASGVKREILFSTASNVEAIRFHDGRATFCTWARRAGWSDNDIRVRTGHSPTSKQVDRYARMESCLADLEYEPFPDVTRAIPELAESATRLHTRLHRRGRSGGGGGGQAHESAAETTESPEGGERVRIREGHQRAPSEGWPGTANRGVSIGSSPTLARPEGPVCNSGGNAIDVVEAALADAVRAASAAGEWERVAKLAAELGARRR